MTVYVGIDPGASGGIAWIDGDTVKVAEIPRYKTRVAVSKLSSFFNGIGTGCDGREDVRVFIEDCPAWGKSPIEQAGNFYGCLYALDLAGRDFVKVPARTWQNAIFGGPIKHPPGTSQSAKTAANKARTIAWCQATYPNVNLVLKKTPHDGVADALAIAHYGKNHV